MRIEPGLIRDKIAALFDEHPELRDDEDLYLDTIEGQTNSFELLDLLIREIKMDESMQQAVAEHINDLKSRKHRFERRETFRRKLVHQILEILGLRKLERPEATLTLRPKIASVVILDEFSVPEKYWRIKRELNLAEIRATLQQGHTVPGTALSNRADTLYLNTK
jgi:hypothetical protein